MWLIVNPALNSEIDSSTMSKFIKSLAEIAILQTKKHIESLQPCQEDRVETALREHCLQYLQRVEEKMCDFQAGFEAGLPATLSYAAFSKIVQKTCMNTS